MSRKRNNLSQSISSLSASIPDIPVVGDKIPLALGDDDTITAVATVSPDGGIKVKSVVGDHNDHIGEPNEMISTPSDIVASPAYPDTSPSPADLFVAWSLTPEGHRVRDSRIPTDPVRLGCILDDNARIAFMAGYAAATPSFE